VVTAGYGDARSYNGGPIEIYHTGIDFSGGVGTPIYAPANGRVVYSDTITLRGTVLIIDHGHGVMSGFYHLSKILVPVGELVGAGQLVAEGGNTGLSTGPHLHWDLRVMNVTVNPLQWTQEIFP
jgi:murein DD-endopeptidase MepM/ murein hydrolase activator NlpD